MAHPYLKTAITAACVTIAIGLAMCPAAFGQLQPINPNIQPNLRLRLGPTAPANEQNCFRLFQEADTGDLPINKYLTSYLCYLMYPERIARELTGEIYKEGDRRTTDIALFESQFKMKMDPMFWNGTDLATRPVIKFFHTNNTAALAHGLDPEAVLISTSRFIIVAFRGTDRVLTPKDLDFNYGEWVGTDFRAPMTTPGPGQLAGKVHQGFWYSLALINGVLDAAVEANDPDHTKHVWVTGHSLGGAQAEIYAQHLVASGTVAANRIHCHMFAPPSFVGDATFASAVEALGTRFQRYDYAMDMVTVVGPGLADVIANGAVASLLGSGCLTCIYVKSGNRNWYEGQSASDYHPNAPERSFPGDHWTFNSGCEHNPNWYVNAIHNQLTTTQRTQVPNKAPCDSLGTACNRTCAPVTEGQVRESIEWLAGNILDNIIGGGDGRYKIACYDFQHWSKRYLRWDGVVGSQLVIAKSATVFTLNHKFTGGYQVLKDVGGVRGNMAADVTFSGTTGLPTGNEASPKIKMTRNDGFIGDEETWFVWRAAPNKNAYVLYNWNTKKVLDAADHCLEGGSCNVNEHNANGKDATQVWILEKQ